MIFCLKLFLKDVINLSSYWLNSIDKKPKFNKVDDNYECDVCIIGGGLTGLSCGYYLSRLGFKVVIIEKDLIGQKASGNTTGKITFQHNLIYDYLIHSYGEKFAKAYLTANKMALNNINKIIDDENIDCDFENLPNYIYTTNQNELTKIHAEIKALHALGENPEFVTDCGLPFKISGAIKTRNQAQFNSVKYMVGLENAIIQNNSLIIENSTATDFEKVGKHYITYVNNHEIKSSNIIVATHYPFKKIARILFCKDVSIHILCNSCGYSFYSF